MTHHSRPTSLLLAHYSLVPLEQKVGYRVVGVIQTALGVGTHLGGGDGGRG